MRKPKHKPYSLRDRILWLSLGLFLGINFWAYCLSPVAQALPSWAYDPDLPKVVIPPSLPPIPSDPVFGKPLQMSTDGCGFVTVFESSEHVYTWKKPDCRFGDEKIPFALLSDTDKDEMRDVRARRLCQKLGSSTFVEYKPEPQSRTQDVLEIEESGKIVKRNYEGERKKPVKYELFEYVRCN